MLETTTYQMEEPVGLSLVSQASVPFRRLWLRVWWRAVCDFVLYKGRKSKKHLKLADGASNWLFGESCYGVCDPDCADSRMSFEAFCEEFSLSPADIRRWILSLDRKEINKIGRNLP